MLGWWYGQGWLWAIKQIDVRLQNIGNIFAVKVLIRTWFAPWKQITSPSSFHNFFQAATDNAISRVVGGIVRTTMLLLALIWALLIIVSGLIWIILWPLLPLGIIILPVLTISKVGL